MIHHSSFFIHHSSFIIPHSSMRVALVHDWLNGMRGGERVLEQLGEIWPLADVHTLFYEPQRVSHAINRHRILPSVLQRLPLTRRYYRYLLPLFPWAMRRMDLREYDLVVSVSHCAAKAAPVPAGIPHVCYCLTPARYLYDQAGAYFGEGRGPAAWIRDGILRRLREWDQETAVQVTHFLAISRFVAGRIEQVYQRKAEVVYPAVETHFFTPPPPGTPREDFYLTVSAAVPYKRLDVVVDAFGAWGKPLVVVGRGPDLAGLRRRARRNIEFLPWVGKRDLRDLYRRARAFVFSAEEDFGITPVEAQASGCPVLAFGKGGARETVREGVSGGFFAEQSVECLLDALSRFQPSSYDPAAIRANSERFACARFRREFIEALRKMTKDEG